MAKNSPVIEFTDVWFSYNRQPVLQEINLVVEKEDFLAVIGPNGGGKTTLLKLLLGLIAPDQGRVRVFGEPPEKVSHRIGYVPQFIEYDREFPVRVLDVVRMGGCRKSSLGLWGGKALRERAMSLLEQLQIADLALRHFGRLSGGQQQRSLVARALMSCPELLVLDEPTASVDIQVEKDIFEILKGLNKEIPIVMVTHDIAFTSRYVNKISCLNRCLVTHSPDSIGTDDVMKLYQMSVTMVHHQCGL